MNDVECKYVDEIEVSVIAFAHLKAVCMRADKFDATRLRYCCNFDNIIFTLISKNGTLINKLDHQMEQIFFQCA